MDIRRLGPDEKIFDLYHWSEVLQESGDGGKVVVCQSKGNQERGGRELVLKMRSKESLQNNRMEEQFRNAQVRLLNMPAHPGIVTVHEVLEDSKFYYMLMEKGTSFFDGLMSQYTDGIMPPGAVKRLVRDILEAVEHVHQQGMLHRDIKPDNFMVHGDQLKLSDFGLALFLPAGKLAAEKCGTPAFMSPEMHRLPRYSRGYTNLCDVWAAGVTMYMVMTGGKHPFLSDGAQEQQQLDERKLHSGALDFSLAESGFFGFAAGSRWCEAAKGCCRRMVEPDMARRATVQEVLTHEWLRRGEKTQTTRSPLGQVARLVRQGTLELSMPTKERSGASAGSLLERGTRCRYHSARYGWMPAVVQSFNESDGTYNLDVRDHARLRDMSPDSTVSAADAWPAYTLVHYQSETLSTWLPAMVRSFNEPKAGAEGSYNLDVRDFASIERIRPRLGLE